MISFVIGALINGVVTWSISRLSLNRNATTQSIEEPVDDEPFPRLPPRTVKQRPMFRFVVAGFGWHRETLWSEWHSNPPSEHAALMTYPAQGDCFYFQTLASFGWPMRCCDLGYSRGSGTAYVGEEHVDVPGPPLGPDANVIFPVRVFWFGAMLNNALFSVPALLVILAASKARRAMRRRTNCCERCAYPLGASHMCPECGMPISGRRAAS